jgi:hypothetical protein
MRVAAQPPARALMAERATRAQVLRKTHFKLVDAMTASFIGAPVSENGQMKQCHRRHAMRLSQFSRDS